MNKIFKVIWHHATQSWVVTSELSKAHGKTASTATTGESNLKINGIYKAGFVYTAIASAILMVSGQVLATNNITGEGYKQDTDKKCFYNPNSESVICGDASTNTIARPDKKPAKSVVIGKGATNTGESNVAVGIGATSAEAASVAIGSEAKALHNQTVAIGQNAEANSDWDISIGRRAGNATLSPVQEGRNIAIGDGALMGAESPNNNTALGTSAAAGMKGNSNVVMGTYANTFEAIETAVTGGSTKKQVGYKLRDSAQEKLSIDKQKSAYIETSNSVAIGTRALATQTADVAVGQQAKAFGGRSVALGNGSKASGTNAIATGSYATATGTNSVAIGGSQNNTDGNRTLASEHFAIAIGGATQALGRSSTALGHQAQAKPEKSVALGYNARAIGTETSSISIGENAYSNASGALVIGKDATAKGIDGGRFKPYNSIAIGTEANVDTIVAEGGKTQERSTDAIAIGSRAKANYASTIAIGYGAKANTKSAATAIGLNSDAQGWKSLALGVEAVASQTDSVALGSNSVANIGFNKIGVDPLNAKEIGSADYAVWKSTKAAVSVGNVAADITRQITSVAAGTEDTDAVNVAQLKAAGFVLDTAATSEGELGTKTVDATKKEADDKVQNGETVTIEADKNIKVTQTAAKVTIATKDDVKFTSVTTGDTVMNNDGITIKAPANQQGLNPTTDVKLTTNGLDNGGNKVVNVADGNVAADSKDAVNGSQLHAVKTTAEGKLGSFTVGADKAATAAGIVVNKDNARFDIVGADSGKVTTAVEGNKVTVDLTQEAKDSLAKADSALQNVVSNDPNLTATKNGDTITLDFSDTPTFKGVTAGEGENQVVLDNKGVNVGGNTYISNAGLNANNKAVMNVASNLPVTNDNTATAGQPNNGTTAQTKPANVDAIKNNAATVADVLNAGFNLQTNGTATDFVKPYDTVNFADGTGTTVTSETDGNKTTFKVNVDAQKLAETAQLPVVYTKADGTKVYKHADGNFYTDPTDKTNKVEPAEIIASMQGANGSTTDPTTLANVQAGKKDTDAVNVSQLKGAVDALGGGAGFNADGSVKAPIYNLIDPTTGTASTVNNVGDALTHLNTAVNKPLTFVGDVGTFDRKLGQTTTVKGGVISEAELSNSNIGVVAKDGTLEIKLAKDVNVDSVVAGGTKIDSNGLTFINANGLPVDNSPSISKTGINAGNQKITSVAKGTDDTDAVNVAQLKEVDAKAGVKTKVTAGEGVDVTNKGTAEAPNYEVALNQATKDSLAKADSAVQGIV